MSTLSYIRIHIGKVKLIIKKERFEADFISKTCITTRVDADLVLRVLLN